MANKQLEGRVFNREGRNYLILEDNDWESDIIRVKTVDARKAVSEMPLSVVVRCLEPGAIQTG